jgi:hypothetical protein
MEQLIILLAIGAISLVNWLIKQSAEARERKKQQARIDRGIENQPEEEALLEPQPSARRQSAPAPDEDPSESMRKLMEALGLPMENEPPKPIQRQAPPPLTPPELPKPLYREPDPYSSRPAQPIRRNEYREPEMPRSLESDPTPEVSLHDWSHKKKPAIAPVAVPEHRFRKMLATPGGLRDAILLSEILGKPKALQ